MLGATELYERLMRQLFMALGARSRWVRWGQGETAHLLDLPGRGALSPVVMVHGFSASGASQFAPLARQLRPHVSRIVLPDLPGHGMSSLPAGGLRAEAMVEALVAALDSALDGPVVMFATSMAGGVAVHYALRRPETLRGLMLCSPSGAPFAPDEIDPFFRTFRIGSHREALAFIDRLYVQPLAEASPIRHVLAWGVRQQFNRPHLVEMLERVPTTEFLVPEDLAALTVPVYLLWGRGDDLLPETHFEFFRRHLAPGAVIDTPEHFGHAPFLHQPREVAERLLGFVRDVC
jgi:pimeloyl-ACP methyl ester carboxylesterase